MSPERLARVALTLTPFLLAVLLWLLVRWFQSMG